MPKSKEVSVFPEGSIDTFSVWGQVPLSSLHEGVHGKISPPGGEREGFMTILVIDGQGGRLGQRLVEQIKNNFPHAELIAVGTNSTATENMLKSGADRAATGENAVVVASRSADIIVGPLGIAVADSLLGEISPAMANAVAASKAYRVLIPMNLCGTYVAGVSQSSTNIVKDAMEHIKSLVEEMRS